MFSSRGKFYRNIILFGIGGATWLSFSMLHAQPGDPQFVVCLFKRCTGYPCPACGSTRSLISILDGDFIGAFALNPIGYILFIAILILPIWIVYDLVSKKETCMISLNRLQFQLNRPAIAIPLILLILANWAWNISKGI
jgi:hypothetical protein